MSTWFIMSIVSLFVPLIMLIFGIVFLKKSPNKINPVYGYRSRRSMKSIEVCLMIIEPSWFEMANSSPYCVKKA